MKKEYLPKQIIKYIAILAIAFLLEIFAGNWSSWRTIGMQETVLARNVVLNGAAVGSPDTTENADAKAPDVTGDADGEAHGVTGDADGEAHGVTGDADAKAHGVTGDADAKAHDVTGDADGEAHGVTGDADAKAPDVTAGVSAWNGTYCTDVCTVDADVKNVRVRMKVQGSEIGHAYAVLTDEGDKYEYATPEFTVCNGVQDTEYSNIYPFGRVHTIQVVVKVAEGCSAEIESISINSSKQVDIKWIRFILVFLILLAGYMVFTDSGLHRIYYDASCRWQKAVTVFIILALIFLGRVLTTEDPVLMKSPWQHHRQYQELAHSLAAGSVELKDHYVDEALLQSDNPYDTIALQVEGIPFSMDYAYYEGHYYAYFGIVPELLFYYPCYKLTGKNLPNYIAVFLEYVIFVIGAYLTVRGLTKRYIHSIPYFYYMGIYVGTVLLANFVYLVWRTDIYNVPIMGAVAFTFVGIGLWLHARCCESRVQGRESQSQDCKNHAQGYESHSQGRKNQVQWCNKKVQRIILLACGSLSMALVAGCRPQFLILSGVAVLLFLLEGGIQNRTLCTKNTIAETVAFVVPYVCVATVVCWYNYARFGNIFNFGATYSLTTNDMNHRGFNFSRLLRSLYCFWLQPAVVNTDFPFLQPSYVDGNYMGRLLTEFMYGGILVANPFFLSIWLWLIKGLKRNQQTVGKTASGAASRAASAAAFETADKASLAVGARENIKKAVAALNMPQIMVGFFVVSAVLVSAFDANAAGVIYRYTCDFAPALVLAAAFLWLLYLDRAKTHIDYMLAARLMYVCLIGSLFYTLLTFCAGGSSVCLENDNVQLFYRIAGYFRF